mgnify:CR=1 FL=1
MVGQARNSEEKCLSLAKGIKIFYSQERFKKTIEIDQVSAEVSILCLNSVNNHKSLDPEIVKLSLEILYRFCHRNTKWGEILSESFSKFKEIADSSLNSGLSIRIIALLLKNNQIDLK